MALTALLVTIGYAAERSLDSALPKPEPLRWNPTPALPRDALRERYRVLLNGSPLDLARFASPRRPSEVAPALGSDLALLHPDGAGGTVYWKAAGRFEPGPAAGLPGIPFPGARVVLSGLSDREDGLSSALYACDADALRGLSESLIRDGWDAVDLRGGTLFSRGGETLLVEPGPPGAALVYWRAP